MQNTDIFTSWIGRIKFKKNETLQIDLKKDKNVLEVKRDLTDITSKVETKQGHMHKKPKLILVWKRLNRGFTKFNVKKCPVNNCETTLDRSKANISHVIVFSGRWHVNFPTHRPKGQIWIFQNREAQVCQILTI